MKKLFILALSIIITSIIFGCSESYEDDMFIVSNKVNLIDNSSHFVTLKDIQTLTNAQGSLTRRSVATEDNIICYTDAEQDTLLYICNKADGGWTIYSSDTRVPAIVAECAKGSFAKASENEALMAWVATIAEDMKVIRRTSDSGLNFTEEEIATNKEFWESVNNNASKLSNVIPKRRIKELPGFDSIIEPPGHYELYSVYTHHNVSCSIPRLTDTDWNQWYPYNRACPLITGSNNNAPAGCVAIAGAQMLYFLHYHLGGPLTAPSQAYCNSTVDDYPDYDWAQNNYTGTIWDSMNVEYNYYPIGYYAAPLIADVGRRVGMHYGNTGSGAQTANLVDNVFDIYGIDCSFNIFHEATLKNNLLNHIPVILKAQPQNGGTGHAFITDRYKGLRTETSFTYKWVYDYIPHNPDGSLIPIPCYPDSIVFSFSQPNITMIGMNWGWGSYYNDDSEWFTLTGDWICQNDPYHTNWNLNRFMICNFRVAD